MKLNIAAPIVSLCLVGFNLVAADPAKPVDLSKDKVLYEVGYSHLDTQWRWTYPQVISEFIPNTVHANIPMFEKYPDYIFNWSGANRYRFMKEYHPQDFEKVRALVAKGRWFPAGSSWEENDVNVPSSESLIRQILFGHDFFKKEFGTESCEFMIPDCFGFPASLPSVLAHCGLRGFSTQKLTWGSAVGIPFNVGVWEGLDGESVIAALNPGSYVSQIRQDLSVNANWINRLKRTARPAAFMPITPITASVTAAALRGKVQSGGWKRVAPIPPPLCMSFPRGPTRCFAISPMPRKRISRNTKAIFCSRAIPPARSLPKHT